MTTAEDRAADRAADAADKTADKSATERAATEKVGALNGAQSVADAVKRIADAAVAEISKTTVAAPPELTFSGTPGGRFRIDGSGFGTNGTVKVGGVQLNSISWSTTRIEGTMPANVSTGDVVVQIDDKTARRGRFVRTT